MAAEAVGGELRHYAIHVVLGNLAEALDELFGELSSQKDVVDDHPVPSVQHLLDDVTDVHVGARVPNLVGRYLDLNESVKKWSANVPTHLCVQLTGELNSRECLNASKI